jgi:hypothetical protein
MHWLNKKSLRGKNKSVVTRRLWVKNTSCGPFKTYLIRQLIKSLRSSVIGRDNFSSNFPSAGKVFRRAALTLLRRNHAARVAVVLAVTPFRSELVGVALQLGLRTPRIPRFAPDTRGEGLRPPHVR